MTPEPSRLVSVPGHRSDKYVRRSGGVVEVSESWLDTMRGDKVVHRHRTMVRIAGDVTDAEALQYLNWRNNMFLVEMPEWVKVEMS